MRGNIHHALGLHMHQPPGNLRLLIETNPWEAEQIIRCYERPARYALQYRDVARLHVGFSGVLLEQLLNPEIVDRYRHIVDIPQMLARYAEADNIEPIGMGYFHPIFPLVPREDWREQLEQGREAVAGVFGRAPRGFWPPEMAFTMEMIPALVEAGYDYVVVDGVHVRPEDGINDVFRPYLACHDGVCIAVIPRDRDVSNAQESGLDPDWFQNEVRWRVGGSPRPDEPRLVTTWSDGENGGWFRQTHEGSGFFGHFFSPYMEHFRGGDYPVEPVLIGEYLERVQPVAQAKVQTGAWNVGSTSGCDLSQWAGTESQRAAVDEVRRLSERWWSLNDRAAAGGSASAGVESGLAEARRLILESETSCFLFWGDSWIPHLYARTRPADAALDRVESELGRAPEDLSTVPAGSPSPSPARTDPAARVSQPGSVAGAVSRSAPRPDLGPAPQPLKSERARSNPLPGAVPEPETQVSDPAPVHPATGASTGAGSRRNTEKRGHSGKSASERSGRRQTKGSGSAASPPKSGPHTTRPAKKTGMRRGPGPRGRDQGPGGRRGPGR